MAVEVPDGLPPVTGDRDRLIQVVINLISNAVKFTPTGTITCSAGLTADDGRPLLIVSVADTGMGIAPEDQAKVFEQFSQAGDTLADTPRGTGLGLPICREIVEQHGGRLWVELEVGHGSTFSFTLPVAAPEAAGRDRDDRGSRGAAGGRVTAGLTGAPGAAASAATARSLVLLGDLVQLGLPVVLRPGRARLRPAALVRHVVALGQHVQDHQRDRPEQDPEDPPDPGPPAEPWGDLVAVIGAQQPDDAAEDDKAGSDEGGGIHARSVASGAGDEAVAGRPGARSVAQYWNSSSRYFGSGQRSSATSVSS